MTLWWLVISSLFSACAISENEAISKAVAVEQYYKAVESNHAPSISAFKRTLRNIDAIIEPIGWTVSGKSFADVISGEISFETKIINVPPSYKQRDRRSGTISLQIIHIYKLDLPEYFEFTGRSRTGFASIENDKIFLNHRRETEPKVFEETIEHELSHILDRPLYSKLSHKDLEVRAMIRGLSKGNIHEINRDRLFYALEQGTETYHNAAKRLLESFSLVITGSENFEALRTIDADVIHFTASALETLLGL